MRVDQQYIEDRVAFVPESGCWVWMKAVQPNGYGVLGISQRRHYAHRVAYELYVGEIPKGMNVLHRCDVPQCCNPAHLFLGTQKDNVRDAVSKGRMKVGAAGPSNFTGKLPYEAVVAIRKLGDEGMRQVDIAAMYGIHQTHVSKLLRLEQRVFE